MAKAKITFMGRNIPARLQARIAQDPNAQFIEITEIFTVQPSGTVTRDNVIKQGESFDILMTVAYSDLLGNLQANFVAKIMCFNWESGDLASTYSDTNITGQLVPGAGGGSFEIRLPISSANELGVFTIAGSIILPVTSLADFTLGGPAHAGIDPNTGLPIPQKLLVSNFHVHE